MSLKDYIKPYKWPLLLFGLCVCATSSMVLAIGKGLGFFIDRGLASGDKTILFESLTILFAIIIFLSIAMFGRFFLITYYGERIINDIRRDIFANLINLSAEFFEKNKIGELLSRITNDLAILQNILSSSISILIRNILLFFGCLILLIMIDAKLTLMVFAIVPIIVLPIVFLGKKLRKLSKKTQDKAADMAVLMEENISFVKLIQSYNNQSYAQKKFNNSIVQLLNVAKARILLRSFLTILVIIIVFSGVAFILYRGGNLVFVGQISAGEFSQFLFYTILLAGSFGAMSEVFGSVQKARGATERLFSLLKEKPHIIDGTKIVKNFESLEFKNVSFCYPSRTENSLNNINFKISKGDNIAIIGSSGSGKTTIFELLQRFYEVSSGEILINGENIKNYRLSSLRNLFAYVSQDDLLFSTSVKENLLFAKQNSKQSEIEDVAKKVKAHNFISNLPEKYHNYLGEKGIRLSGGERQRISLARGLLKGSQCLLLDEPTSNLDGKNESSLQKIFKSLKGKKTIIMITHRNSSAEDADLIIKIEKGEIAGIS